MCCYKIINHRLLYKVKDKPPIGKTVAGALVAGVLMNLLVNINFKKKKEIPETKEEIIIDKGRYDEK